MPQAFNLNIPITTFIRSYSFQGQEEDDEWLDGAVSFKYRIHDARIGRFLSIDPLAPDYPWNSPYAFSENRVIDAIELEGLEAWLINNQWSEEHINQFRSEIEVRTAEYVQNEIRMSCEDFAIYVLIDFASENGLPVSFFNGTGHYDASDPRFSDVDQFRVDVATTTGARDLLINTNAVNLGNEQAGDLYLMDLNHDGTVNHTQVVTSKNALGSSIRQGNWDGSFFRSDEDPTNERFYFGAVVQEGVYLSGQYMRFGTENPSWQDGLQDESFFFPRMWDFEQFNWRDDIFKTIERSEQPEQQDYEIGPRLEDGSF